MSTTLKIQYVNSVMPIEETTLLDGSQTVISVYSNSDKNYGGNRTIAASTLANNAGGIAIGHNGTTETNYVQLGTEQNNNKFFSVVLPTDKLLKGLGIFIKKNVNANYVPEVIITVGEGVTWVELVRLEGVGDGIFLPLNNVEQSKIKIKSSTNKTCIVEAIAIY